MNVSAADPKLTVRKYFFPECVPEGLQILVVNVAGGNGCCKRHQSWFIKPISMGGFTISNIRNGAVLVFSFVGLKARKYLSQSDFDRCSNGRGSYRAG